jgi:hypothetical protein
MTASAELTLELDEALRAELRDGEELWYAGMPAPKYAARKTIPIAVFGLFFGGFAAVWITMAVTITWFGGGAGAKGGSPPATAIATDDDAARQGEGDPAGDAPPTAGAGDAAQSTAAGSGTSAPTGVLALLFPLFGLPFLAIGAGLISSPWWAARAARRTGCFVTSQRALRIKVGRSIKVDAWSPSDLGEISKTLYRDGHGCVAFATRLQRTSKGHTRTVSDGFDGVPDPRACEEALLALKASASAKDAPTDAPR